MTDIQSLRSETIFNLEHRTTEFAKSVIRLCKKLPKDPINNRIMGQLVGSAGSVGANYREGNDALGRKDFANRMRIARKEAKETLHWLELLVEANPMYKDEARKLWKEAEELKKILSAIIKKTQ